MPRKCQEPACQKAPIYNFPTLEEKIKTFLSNKFDVFACRFNEEGISDVNWVPLMSWDMFRSLCGAASDDEKQEFARFFQDELLRRDFFNMAAGGAAEGVCAAASQGTASSLNEYNYVYYVASRFYLRMVEDIVKKQQRPRRLKRRPLGSGIFLKV